MKPAEPSDQVCKGFPVFGITLKGTFSRIVAIQTNLKPLPYR
jgi:hypothetical protein